jgi:hypothetical protein
MVPTANSSRIYATSHRRSKVSLAIPEKKVIPKIVISNESLCTIPKFLTRNCVAPEANIREIQKEIDLVALIPDGYTE